MGRNFGRWRLTGLVLGLALAGCGATAGSLVGCTHVIGERITTSGSCRVAGESGTVFHLESPRGAASLPVQTATGCAAQRSGALLSYTAGVPSGSAARAHHIAGASLRFTLDSIGGVGVITALRALAATPAATPPPASSVTAQLPPASPLR